MTCDLTPASHENIKLYDYTVCMYSPFLPVEPSINNYNFFQERP